MWYSPQPIKMHQEDLEEAREIVSLVPLEDDQHYIHFLKKSQEDEHCVLCQDLEEGALHLLMHPTDSRVHTYKVTRAFLEVKYLKEVAVTSKGESSEIVFIMTVLET